MGVFFTLKIVGAVTDSRLNALCFAGTVALAGLIWALVVAASVHPGCIRDETGRAGCLDASAGARAPSCPISMLLPKDDSQQDDSWHVPARDA